MISSIEIKQHSFNKSLRGFDTDEVKAYLNSLSVEFEKLQEENKRLKIDLERTKVELVKTQEQLSRFHELEEIMHKTLQQAEQTARTTQDTAEKNAQAKFKEVEFKANELIQQAYRERTKLEHELNELLYRKTDLIQQMRLFLSTQTERLMQFEQTTTTAFSASSETLRNTLLPPVTQVEFPAIESTKIPQKQDTKLNATSFFESSLNISNKNGSLSSEIADEL